MAGERVDRRGMREGAESAANTKYFEAGEAGAEAFERRLHLPGQQQQSRGAYIQLRYSGYDT